MIDEPCSLISSSTKGWDTKWFRGSKSPSQGLLPKLLRAPALAEREGYMAIESRRRPHSPANRPICVIKDTCVATGTASIRSVHRPPVQHLAALSTAPRASVLTCGSSLETRDVPSHPLPYTWRSSVAFCTSCQRVVPKSREFKWWRSCRRRATQKLQHFVCGAIGAPITL